MRLHRLATTRLPGPRRPDVAQAAGRERMLLNAVPGDNLELAQLAPAAKMAIVIDVLKGRARIASPIRALSKFRSTPVGFARILAFTTNSPRQSRSRQA
ncbi:hypothetical protein [Burkholderia seminalis]|uniref:hypothetical protein n=1 Tax=Burkholderia seminalis TaxID=488731 RepID=UPI0026512F63|nr:hypothetical protein [Burkholderia seminalis]MDN7585493.1 hypothetical protein [Burkholderia seminalis]